MKKGKQNTCKNGAKCYPYAASGLEGQKTRRIMIKNAPVQDDNRFKVLRAVDPAILGGTQPLQVAKEVHFPNAQGGLRLVTHGEVRQLAKNSAQGLISYSASLNLREWGEV